MKALFVGLGSIGTRHLRNLSVLCCEQGIPLEVVALRSSDRHLPPEVAALVARQVSQLPAEEKYDLAFITNPTHLHAQVLQQLKERVGTFFIEKPIFDSAGYDLQAMGLCGAQKAYVAAPMRFCGLYPALKTMLNTMPVYSVRVICSSYLPGWRPGGDYRAVYSAHREMGGGVALDLIHEWDYLFDLFGPPEETACLRGKFSDLEINADDLAVYIARYKDFLCEVHLDYFGREYRRMLEVFSKEGTLVADFGNGLLHLPDGSVQDYAEPTGRRYEREMAYFLEYARGEDVAGINRPALAVEVLKTAIGE